MKRRIGELLPPPKSGSDLGRGKKSPERGDFSSQRASEFRQLAQQPAEVFETYVGECHAARHQLGRRNLTPAEVALYVGQRYRLEKREQGGTGANQHSQTRQTDGSAEDDGTAERLAREHGMSPRTVERHAERGGEEAQKEK